MGVAWRYSLVPKVRLLGGQLFGAAHQTHAPACDAAIFLLFVTDDLKFAHLGAAWVFHGVLLGFHLESGVGLAVFKEHLNGHGSVIGSPKNGVILADALIDLGAGNGSVQVVVALKGNGWIYDCTDLAWHQVVVLHFNDFATWADAGGRAGAQCDKRQSQGHLAE